MIHFSVVTVVKNDLVGLKKSRASLEAQRYKNWNHIIIDGKSDAATLKYLRGLPKENTTWVSELDSGIYSAMNKGWKIADPESFVFYLNAGDVFAYRDSLHFASVAIKENPEVRWGCTTHEEKSQDGETWYCKLVSRPSLRNQLYAFGYRSHQGMLMKKEFISVLGGFDESLIVAADWDLFARAITHEKPFTWIEPLACFELGGESSRRMLTAHKELENLRKIYFLETPMDLIFDFIWKTIYLRYFGYRNWFTLIIDLNQRILEIRKTIFISFIAFFTKGRRIDFGIVIIHSSLEWRIKSRTSPAPNRKKYSRRPRELGSVTQKWTLIRMVHRRLQILPLEAPQRSIGHS